jgi:hypothetical protein
MGQINPLHALLFSFFILTHAVIYAYVFQVVSLKILRSFLFSPLCDACLSYVITSNTFASSKIIKRLVTQLLPLCYFLLSHSQFQISFSAPHSQALSPLWSSINVKD